MYCHLNLKLFAWQTSASKVKSCLLRNSLPGAPLKIEKIRVPSTEVAKNISLKSLFLENCLENMNSFYFPPIFKFENFLFCLNRSHFISRMFVQYPKGFH